MYKDSLCAQSTLIYTGDDDSNNNNNNNDDIHIYCMAYESCYGSTLRTTNSILCGTYSACLNSLIMSSNKVYCLKFSCTDAILLAIDEIYIINSQNGLNVFSGAKSTTSIYFNGKNSGDNVYYKCEGNSVCYIYCENAACSSTTTLIICDTKCFVTCNGIYGNSDCVNIVISLSPSNAPTAAPSSAPSQPPTMSPSVKHVTPNVLTEQDVSEWFNWML